MTVSVSVRRLAHAADLPLPAYATAGAAGMDLMAAVDVTLAPGGRALVATGLQIALPPGFEAQVRPQDVAFLRPGQPAKVKLTAYDPSIFGSLNATLEHIGADSITTEKGETYYVVRVRTEKSYLEYRGQVLPILPGMVADVDVITGAKTVLTYLTKPMVRIRDMGLRER